MDQKTVKETPIIRLDLNPEDNLGRKEEDITSDESFEIAYDEIADEDFDNLKQQHTNIATATKSSGKYFNSSNIAASVELMNKANYDKLTKQTFVSDDQPLDI